MTTSSLVALCNFICAVSIACLYCFVKHYEIFLLFLKLHIAIYFVAQREQLASGTLQKAGYYTVDFDTKVSLKKGERYAVLVYLKTPRTKHPMAIEYDTGEKILQGVDLDDGEGYISLNGKNFVNVKEKKDCNLCIKAFTRD